MHPLLILALSGLGLAALGFFFYGLFDAGSRWDDDREREFLDGRPEGPPL
jgi:hypothetical protein